MQEIFVKTEDNHKIAINHYDSGRENVLIMCPGWYMTKDSKYFRAMAEDFLPNTDVIAMDFRGHGRSSGVYTFSALEVADLKAVVDFAKKKYSQVNLMGFSLGGAISIIYTAISQQGCFSDLGKPQESEENVISENRIANSHLTCYKNKNINSMIYVSPPADFDKIENHVFKKEAFVPTMQKFELDRSLSIRPGNPFLNKTKPIDVVENISPVPALFIAGGKDPTVYPWHTQALYEKAGVPKAFELFENDFHAEDLYINSRERFLKLCADWLDQKEWVKL